MYPVGNTWYTPQSATKEIVEERATIKSVSLFLKPAKYAETSNGVCAAYIFHNSEE
jgi:hypothetical protein